MPDNVMQARDPDDVPSGSRPIEGVGTAVAAFVGLAAKGPAHEPTLVRSWTEYAEIFGGYTQNAYLAHAVNGYFLNGGHAAYIVRAGDSGIGLRLPDFSGLEAIDDVTILAAPDLTVAQEAGDLDLEAAQSAQRTMITHCEIMGDRLAILDPPPGLSPHQVTDWRVAQAGYDSAYATVYYPWLHVVDPSDGGRRTVPPSGHAAGIWARTDEERGVHAAPANETVRGAVALEIDLTHAEQELLNPNGINSIRSFPGRGIRVWGARTLSSDPEWRYVNIRRLVNYLEESIAEGTRWVVLEPNDEDLCARIRRSVTAFLVDEWRRGALSGRTPAEAFYVTCDRETNPAEAGDAGPVTFLVGVAPVKPAEFVVFRVTHDPGRTTNVSE